MNPRLLILVVAAVILAALAAMKLLNPAPAKMTSAPGEMMTPPERLILEEKNRMLDERDLPGEEPAEHRSLAGSKTDQAARSR